MCTGWSVATCAAHSESHDRQPDAWLQQLVLLSNCHKGLAKINEAMYSKQFQFLPCRFYVWVSLHANLSVYSSRSSLDLGFGTWTPKAAFSFDKTSTFHYLSRMYPNTITYNGIISAHEKGHQWQRALHFLFWMFEAWSDLYARIRAAVYSFWD